MMKNLSLLIVAMVISLFCYTQNIITDLPNTNLDTIARNNLLDSLFRDRSEIIFKFKVQTKYELFGITTIVSIDNYNSTTNEVTAYANKQDFENFLYLNKPYELVEKPISKAYVMASSLDDFISTYSKYPTYSQYDALMTKFETDHSNICKRYDIGTLNSGHKIIALKVTSNVNTNAAKVKVLYESSLHGDEVTGYVLILRLIDYLTTQYDASNPQAVNILDNVELWFLPDQNPDGTYKTDDNTIGLSPTSIRGNANSIDCNRNFPDFVGGPHPDGREWQEEVVITRNFQDTSNFTLALQYHGGTEVFNYYYDTYTSAANLPTDDTWWRYVGGVYVASARANATGGAGAFTNTDPTGVTEGGDWYWVFGGAQDYANYYNRDRFAYLEVSVPKTPQNTVTTPLLSTYWTVNYQAMLLYIEQALYGLRGTITDATDGDPVVANISIPTDKDNTDVYSNSDFGDYYRPIAAGTYNVTFSAPGYVSQTINGISITNNIATVRNVSLVRATPVANFVADNTSSVDGKIVFTNTSTAMSNATWLWTFNDGNTSTEKEPIHYYTSSGTYSVTLNLYSEAGNTNITKTNYITVTLPSAPSVTPPAAQCGSGSFSLTATGGTIYNWYDSPTGGNLLFTGANYNTPVISSTTTYYVENEIKQSTTTMGKTYAAGTNQTNSPGAWYLKFDALQSIRLESVVMNPSSTTARLIQVHDENNNLVASKLWTPSATGSQTVSLDFYIPKGTGYKISARMNGTGAVPNLSYSTSGFTFPTSYSLISITGSFYATTGPLPTYDTYYMYFYDWKVASASQRSARTAVTCTINQTPTITGQPSSPAAVCAGTGTPTFSVTASGTGLTYQWQEYISSWNNVSNGGVYSGVTTSSLTITNPPIGMNGYKYRCVVANGTCSTNSDGNATLTVNTTPSITGQPANAAACEGGNATFTVTATGGGLTYQWQEYISSWTNVSNGGIYSGATASSLVLTNPPAGMSGYKYRCTVSGTCAPSVTSDGNATLSFSPLPSAAGTISGTAIVTQGQNGVAYSVGAISNATSYTWTFSGTGATINGSTNNITIDFSGTATSGILRVSGTNACGNGTVSADYTITVGSTGAFYLTAAGAGSAQTLASWNTNPAGGGSTPGDFITNGSVFIIPAGISGTFGANTTFGKPGGGGAAVTLQIDGTVTINSGTTVTVTSKNIGSTVNIVGTIIFSSTSAVQLALVSGGSASVNFTLNSGATLKTVNTTGINGTNCSVFASGTTPGTPSFSTSANYEFNGADQTMTGLPTTVNNLIIGGSGSKTMAAGLTVNGILSMEGTATVSAAPNTYGASSSIKYNGSGAQTTSVEFPSTFSGSGGLIIANTSGSTVSISGAKVISGPLTINNGAKFEIGSTSSLTVGGNTSNSGTFTIKSNVSGTGSFIDNGTITGSGTFTVEKYLTDSRWWYLGAPLSNATAIAFGSLTPGGTPSGNHLYYWNETGHAYVNITNTADAMPALRGYSFKRYDASAITATYTGTLNTGLIGATNNLTYTSGTSQGFNLVCNPYPSAINWGSEASPTTGLTQTNLITTIWYRTGGNFATYNWSLGTGQNGGQQYIPAMQAFWVRTLGSTGGLQLTNATRVHNAQAFYKETSEINILRIQVDNNALSDEAVVAFLTDATDNDDAFDSEKMFSDDEYYPQIYTLTSENTKAAINGVSELTDYEIRTLSLGFKTRVAGTFTLQVTNLDVFDPSIDVYLEDSQLNYFQNLNDNNTYSFTSGITDNASRFKLHFGRIITNIESAPESALQCYVFGNAVYINTQNSSMAEIYNVIGEKITQQQINTGLNKIQLNTSTGIYIVKIIAGTEIITKKVFVGE